MRNRKESRKEGEVNTGDQEVYKVLLVSLGNGINR